MDLRLNTYLSSVYTSGYFADHFHEWDSTAQNLPNVLSGFEVFVTLALSVLRTVSQIVSHLAQIAH